MSAKSLCVLALSLLCLTAVDAAPVTYQFFADSAFDTSGMTGISGGFTYVASDFISANLTVPLANLSTCTVTAIPSAVCGDMSFAPGAYGYDPVAIGIPTSPSSGVSILYYFNRGAFAAPGSYHTDDAVFGNRQAGRLLVSAVPEPQSAAMLLAGLGLITAGMLRRKAGPVAALRPSTPG